MGSVYSYVWGAPPEQEPTPPPGSRIQQVDVLKSKLKIVRDKIQNFIGAKQQQLGEVQEELLAKYKAGQSKKQLLQALIAKKELIELVENGNSRLQVISKTLRQVEIQQLDSNIVDVLQQANSYMETVQKELEDKDWRGIVEQANTKYEGVDWKVEEEEDQQFKELWRKLGGDQLDNPGSAGLKNEQLLCEGVVEVKVESKIQQPRAVQHVVQYS